MIGVTMEWPPRAPQTVGIGSSMSLSLMSVPPLSP
jgi:hypothetical protein